MVNVFACIIELSHSEFSFSVVVQLAQKIYVPVARATDDI